MKLNDTRKAATNVRLPNNELTLVRLFAKLEKIQLSDYIRSAVHEYNEKKKKEFNWKAPRRA